VEKKVEVEEMQARGASVVVETQLMRKPGVDVVEGVSRRASLCRET
jgi:hypothetical protein